MCVSCLERPGHAGLPFRAGTLTQRTGDVRRLSTAVAVETQTDSLPRPLVNRSVEKVNTPKIHKDTLEAAC